MMKKIAVALVAAGGLLVAAVPAHAGGHVSLSLGVGLPVAGYGYGYAPAPTYYGPPPVVYVRPAPVYGAPVYYGPPRPYGPRWYGPRHDAPRAIYRPAPRDGWDDHRDWRR